MAESEIKMTRTGWDVVLGGLLVLAGLLILGHAALATRVSVLFVGAVLLVAGVLGLGSALARIKRGGFWASALSGGLLVVLGLVMLRNTEAAAVTLTLVAGALFLAGGIVRLVAAGEQPEHRVALAVSGVLSAALGLLVLFNIFTASFVLLGVLLGLETIGDGIAMVLMGRLRVVPKASPGGPRLATP